MAPMLCLPILWVTRLQTADSSHPAGWHLIPSFLLQKVFQKWTCSFQYLSLRWSQWFPNWSVHLQPTPPPVLPAHCWPVNLPTVHLWLLKAWIPQNFPPKASPLAWVDRLFTVLLLFSIFSYLPWCKPSDRMSYNSPNILWLCLSPCFFLSPDFFFLNSKC